MPIYILQCNECLNTFEEILSMDEANPCCDKCGGGTSKKLTSPAIITIKNGAIPTRSKGYKDGYSKDYLKSIGKS